MTTSEILVQYINETLGIPVYFDHAPLVGATYPCIAYKKIASESDHTFDGPAYSTDTYEFTVLTIKGSNAGINVPLYGIEGARFWAKSLNTILDGYDTSMYSINTSYNEEYDDDTATYQVMQSYGLLLMTGDVYTGSWTGSSQYSDILRGNGTPGNVAIWESPYVITETNTLTVSGSDVIMVGDLTVHGAIHAVISASTDSSSYADKAHLADTASYSNYAALAGTSSFAVTSSYAVTSTTANTASYLTGTIASASYATTASYALNSQSIPAGVLSSSAQVDYNQIQNKPTAIATASYVLNAVSASYAPMADGVVSSSVQVFKNSGVYSSSLQLPAGIYSSSAQLPAGIISSSAQLPDGVVSSSAQVLNGSNVYSSSAQLPTGIVSGSSQIANWSVATASYALNSQSIPAGVISSSQQVDYNEIKNKPTTIESSSYATTASYIKLPDGIVSSSAQVLTGSNVYSSSAQLPSGLVSSSAQVDYTFIQNQPTTIATASYVLSASHALTSSCVIRNSGSFYNSVVAVNIPFDNILAKSAILLDSLSITNGNGLGSGYLYVAGDASIENDLEIYNNFNVLYGTASIDTLVVTNPINGTSSWSDKSVSASYAPLPANVVSSSAQVLNGSGVYSSSAQLPSGIVSGSTIATASYALNIPFANVRNKPSLVSSSLQFKATDNVTFGQIAASSIQVDTIHVQTITSSIVYSSGSNKFGDDQTDKHEFTGSVSVSGSLTVMGGNVGIGTNNPVKKLDVAGGVHFGIGTENISNSSNGLSVQDSSGAGVAIAVGTTTARSTGMVWYNGNPGSAVWYTFRDAAPITITGRDLHLASGGAERLTVTNNGNVGIGTNAPGGVLDVAKPSGGRVQVLSEGANTYNVIASRNAADSAYLPLIVRSGTTTFESGVIVSGPSAYVQTHDQGNQANYSTFYRNSGVTRLWDNAAGDVISFGTTGAVRFHAYGAGTLVTDSAGNVTALAGQQNVSTTSTPQFASVFARGVTTAGAGTLEAQSSDYSFTYCSTTVSQFGSTVTGTSCGIAQASAGVVQFRNTSAGIIYTNGPAPLVLGTNNTDRLHITAAGNVGIGTISPAIKLEVAGVGSDNSLKAGISVVDTGINGRRFVMASRVSTFTISDETAAASRVVIKSTGALQFVAYGAGTLVTDSSGNIAATSDARMKNISGSFDRGLDAIVNLSPKVYRWNEASGLNTDDVNVGLIAQEVLPYIPEAVSEKDGRYTMSDRPIIAALINAVKELAQKNTTLEAKYATLEARIASLEA